MEETLDTKVNMNVRSGLDNKAVKTYLNMVGDSVSVKTVQQSDYTAIQDLLTSNFDISDPTGSRKLNSYRLYQALWRTANRMKPLDFMIHGTGIPEWKEKIVSAGIGTVMDRGGYDSALRDKNGVFFNMLLYGDGPLMIGMNPDKKSYAPLLFTPFSAVNLYMDGFSTGIRNRGMAGSAYRAMAIFSYSWNYATELWPQLKKNGGIGKIPRERNAWLKQQERSYEQTFNLEDEVEIGFGFDIHKKNFVVFAGEACTVLEEFNGADYPFVRDDGTPYIPILQFICIPSSEGPFNYGIGHLLYKLALVTQRLLNMELGHAEDNTYPITLVNTPQGEAANFFAKLVEANKMRAAGKKPFVAMEYDPNNPNSSNVQAQSLLTQNLTNEWQLIYNTLIDEIQMLGINLKELTREGNPTATEILSDEENSSSWVKQMMEYNASESQCAVEITMDAVKKFVSKKSKTPLNLTSKVLYEGKEIRPDMITMGMLSTELKDGNYWVKINSRTGTIPSDTMRRAKAMQLLPMAAPGSKAQKALLGTLSGINDLDLVGEDFLPEMQPQMPGGVGNVVEEGAAPVIASETERLTFNPRRAEQEPVF